MFVYDVCVCDVGVCDVGVCDVGVCDVFVCDVFVCDGRVCDGRVWRNYFTAYVRIYVSCTLLQMDTEDTTAAAAGGRHYEQDDCVHNWVPHQHQPLSCLYFLDNHAAMQE